jgi:flagella basal body P-ring formation protein FlgA
MKILINILIVIFTANLVADSNFSGERLEESCVNFIQKSIKNSKVKILSSIADQRFISDNIKAGIELSEDRIGSSSVKLVFKDNNDIVRELNIPIKIEILQKVPIFNSGFSSGNQISINDLKYKKMYLDKNVEDIIKYLDILKLKRSVRKGEIASIEHFEEIPLINRGDDVALRVISGKVEIKTSGEALNDAKIGEKVRVKKKNSQIVIEGVALNDGSILIR